jgi:hypothetical protein
MTDDDIAKARETIDSGKRSRDASWFTPPYWNAILEGWSAALDNHAAQAAKLLEQQTARIERLEMLLRGAAKIFRSEGISALADTLIAAADGAE